MKNPLKTALFLLLLAGCQPQEKKPAVETSPNVVQDSLTTTGKDGITKEKPEQSRREEMPPALVNQLNKYYPGWKIPEISESYLKNLNLTNRNIIWIKGDFDGNNQEDLAAQFRLRDSVYVAAFLQQTRPDTYKNVIIEKTLPVKTSDLNSASLFYISVYARNDTAYNYHENRKEVLPSDAIGIGVENDTQMYYYRNGKWKMLLKAN